MKIKEGFMLRQVAGQHIVMPLGQKALDFNCAITLNESGAFLWSVLEKGVADKNELLSKLLEEYDVEENVALQDIDAFLKKQMSMIDIATGLTIGSIRYCLNNLCTQVYSTVLFNFKIKTRSAFYVLIIFIQKHFSLKLFYKTKRNIRKIGFFILVNIRPGINCRKK